MHVHYKTSVKIEPAKNINSGNTLKLFFQFWSQKLTERNISVELVTK